MVVDPGSGGLGETIRFSLEGNLKRLLLEEPGHSLSLARVSLDELCESARFLKEHLLGAPLAWKGSDERPFLLTTELGTVREMDMPPAACKAGDLSDLSEMHIGVVGLPEYPAFDPSYLAEDLGQRCGEPERFLPLMPSFVLGDGRPLDAVVLARMIEEGGAEQLAVSLAQMVSETGLSHLMFPPLMGLSGSPGLLAMIREATGLHPFEALAVTTRCPGLRMLHALHEVADSFGVSRVQGEVGVVEILNRQVIAAAVQSPSDGMIRRVGVDTLVLATGDLYGGGLLWGDWPQEAILGLPVVPGPGGSTHPTPCMRPLGLSLGPDPAAEHAALGAGVMVDQWLRPLSPGGEVILDNLYACGALLCGHDPGARRGGTGVALVTGRRAGQLAAGGSIG